MYWYRVEIDCAQARPLMLFLHGYGETGGDSVEQTSTHGPWCRSNPAVARELSNFFRIAPHIAEQGGEWNTGELIALVRETFRRYIDVSSAGISVVGISRGGWGALDFVSACPQEIAVSGSAVFCPEHAHNLPAALTRAPILLFHCATDELVKISETRRRLYHELESRPDFRWVRVHPSWTRGAKRHNCWTEVLAQQGLYEWFVGMRGVGDYAHSKDRWPDFTHFERPKPD